MKEFFRLDNTQGYNQQELDGHNEACNEFVISKGGDVNIDEDSCWYDEIRHYRDEYFNKFMC